MKCYSINRRLPAPLQLYLTSFHSEAKAGEQIMRLYAAFVLYKLQTWKASHRLSTGNKVSKAKKLVKPVLRSGLSKLDDYILYQAEMEKNDGYQHWDMHFREQLLRKGLLTEQKLKVLSIRKSLLKLPYC
jgi:hypothetical protein